jgi:hypothetical protein
MTRTSTRTHAPTLILLLLFTIPTAAQQGGSNFHVLANGADITYLGLGAGGSQVGGEDGVGHWVDGEEMRGNTFTSLGDYGYAQMGWRASPCVLGPAPTPGMTLSLNFPLIALVELDGVNPFDQGANVWSRAACAPSLALPTVGCFPIGGSGGIPFGPVGASAQFLVSGLPSGVSSFASNLHVLIPNNGLQGPTALPSATATIIGLASDASLGIGSTGFCWLVTFNWLPSAVPALDDINGWWTWKTNSVHGNQYWPWSNDEQSIWQSNTVATDVGCSALVAFFGNVEVEAISIVPAPATNVATAPNGLNQMSPYAFIGSDPFGGNSVNGGFDLGRHGGVSLNGAGGAMTGTGFGGQDPAAAGLSNVPTLGFVTWNNGPQSVATGGFGDPRSHVTWVQTWFDGILAGLSGGVSGDPGTNGTPDLPVAPSTGVNRFPLTLQESIAFAFPSADVAFYGPLFLHLVQDQTGVTAWPDPYGFTPGFGDPPVVGASAHLPLGGALSSLSVGLPVGIQVGTSQLKNVLAPPLLWNTNPGNPYRDAVSHSTIVPLID